MLGVFIGFAPYAHHIEKDNRFLLWLEVWGGRGFAVSRKRESLGKNLPRQIDDRRHFEL